MNPITIKKAAHKQLVAAGNKEREKNNEYQSAYQDGGAEFVPLVIESGDGHSSIFSSQTCVLSSKTI